MSTTSVAHNQSGAPVKEQLRYLIKGERLPANASFQRRSFLRTTRYVLKFVFWRLFRYAKYALVASAIAAVGTGVLGTLTGGIGMLIAPSIPVAAAMGVATAAFKFGWRHSSLAKAWREGATGDARADERRDAKEEVQQPRRLDVWERL